MTPPEEERRPRRRGGAPSDHDGNRIDAIVPVGSDAVDALRAALRALGADLELGVHHDRLPVAELVVPLADGLELVAHLSVRRAVGVAL